VLGSVHGLTQSSEYPTICIWKKTLGPPDFFSFIPISNCSA
jgi:hypothetical protein